MARLHINTGYDLSGQGLPPMLPPFPALSGKLYAGYCFGDDYAARGTDPLAARYGARLDWSGNGRHLGTLGSSTFSNWYFDAAVSTDTPLTPFDLDTLAASGVSGEASVICFARTASTAKAISLIRSDTVDPYLQLSLLPQSSNGSAKANMVVSGVTNDAVVTAIDTDLANICIYAGTYRAADRWVYQRGPATPMLKGQDVNAAAVSSTGVFHFGAETGAGDSLTRIYGAAFYDAYLSEAEITTIQEYFRAWHAAAETGLTI